MLACTMQLLDKQGGLLGVAGVEMSLENLRDMLNMVNNNVTSTTYLLDSAGHIITSSVDAVAKFSVGTLINKQNELPIYQQAEIVQRLKRGETGHEMVAEPEGKKLIVFYHIDSVGWYLVVESPFSV